MKQGQLDRSSNQQLAAPFRIKSAAVSLFAMLLIGVYYFVNVLALRPSSEAIPAGALGLVLTTIILIIIVESLLQIILFVGAGRIEQRTKDDDNVYALARRNAHVVLSAGVFATFASMFAGFTPFEMGNLLLLAFLLAEIIQFGSQIVYFRQLERR
jgi:hypothetical protein